MTMANMTEQEFHNYLLQQYRKMVKLIADTFVKYSLDLLKYGWVIVPFALFDMLDVGLIVALLFYLVSKLELLGVQVKQTNNKLARLDTVVDCLHTDVTKLEEVVNCLHKDVECLHKDAECIHKDVETLETSLVVIDRKLTTVEEKVDLAITKIENLQWPY